MVLGVMVLNSCTESKLIGSVNMISNRNIDNSIKYQLLSTYVGGTKKELRKSKAESIEEAINNTVRKVSGGEYLMNVKIWLVKHEIGKAHFAVEGDVWGSQTQQSYQQQPQTKKQEQAQPEKQEQNQQVVNQTNFKGYSIGDKVLYSKKDLFSKKFVYGVVEAFKDEAKCLIKEDGTGKVYEVKYEKLSKTH